MSDHEILGWEIAEARQDATVSKVVTGWDLRDFKRTDGAPEEQEKRKKARAEAKRRWSDAGRQAPSSSDGGRGDEGSRVDQGHGGQHSGRVCQAA